MFEWNSLRVLCLGGGGQTGSEICEQLCGNGVATIFVHDITRERAEAAVATIRSSAGTELVASAGDVFAPAALGTWAFEPATGSVERVCRETDADADPMQRADLLEVLLDARLGAFTPAAVKQSLIWHLIDAYRPHVVVDSINTSTVLGYAGDIVQSGRNVAALARRILGTLKTDPQEPLAVADLYDRVCGLDGDAANAVQRDLVRVLETSLGMTACMDTACMIRFVQCLHAAFDGGPELAIPGFLRYVKVHTTGLGGMGFNIRYTHGDTGEPGLSTKLLGKTCAAGSLTQLLLTLAHTPGCDARAVVPATLVGWTQPPDALIADRTGAPIPLVDSEEPVPCDGSRSLADALAESDGRVTDTGERLEIPYLSSGENRPYAIEDITAVTALGQMGCITKEEVAAATVACVAGDSRYDLLAAIDAALLLPTQTAAVERDRMLPSCGRRDEAGHLLPSVSVGNLGPSTAKHLYEIEIIRAGFESVESVCETDPIKMALRACSYILEDRGGVILRRQILSLGIPIFLAKGPGRCGLLLGKRLLFPDPRDQDALARPLDPDDELVQGWVARGWIDLTGPRMRWWYDRFCQVKDALENDRAVSRNWFDPARPFSAGQFLGYLHSITGGQRKKYM